MKCLRIYATPDGESHFDEVELPTTKRSVHPDAVPFEVSASYQASRVRLTRIPAGMREVTWHTARVGWSFGTAWGSPPQKGSAETIGSAGGEGAKLEALSQPT
jgi:hypothetical protein